MRLYITAGARFNQYVHWYISYFFVMESNRDRNMIKIFTYQKATGFFPLVLQAKLCFNHEVRDTNPNEFKCH